MTKSVLTRRWMLGRGGFGGVVALHQGLHLRHQVRDAEWFGNNIVLVHVSVIETGENECSTYHSGRYGEIDLLRSCIRGHRDDGDMLGDRSLTL